MTPTPDEAVREKILQRLREERLLSNKALSQLAKKLRAGPLSSTDWRRLAEMECREADDGEKDSRET